MLVLRKRTHHSLLMALLPYFKVFPAFGYLSLSSVANLSPVIFPHSIPLWALLSLVHPVIVLLLRNKTAPFLPLCDISVKLVQLRACYILWVVG